MTPLRDAPDDLRIIREKRSFYDAVILMDIQAGYTVYLFRSVSKIALPLSRDSCIIQAANFELEWPQLFNPANNDWHNTHANVSDHQRPFEADVSTSPVADIQETTPKAITTQCSQSDYSNGAGELKPR